MLAVYWGMVACFSPDNDKQRQTPTSRVCDLTGCGARPLELLRVTTPLSPDQWHQLESLVDALLDTPPERRAALFAKVSGGDPARREELERLVAACERTYPLL